MDIGEGTLQQAPANNGRLYSDELQQRRGSDIGETESKEGPEVSVAVCGLTVSIFS